MVASIEINGVLVMMLIDHPLMAWNDRIIAVSKPLCIVDMIDSFHNPRMIKDNFMWIQYDCVLLVIWVVPVILLLRHGIASMIVCDKFRDVAAVGACLICCRSPRSPTKSSNLCVFQCLKCYHDS